MMKRLLALGGMSGLLAACAASDGTRPCVVRRPAHVTAGVVVPRLAELRPMLEDAARDIAPARDPSGRSRRLQQRIEQLSLSLDRGTSEDRCRALNASLETFAKLDAAPGSAHQLNALALTLDLTALALIDSQPNAAGSPIPSRNNR